MFNCMLVLVEGASCVLCGVAAAEHTYRTRDDTYAGADDGANDWNLDHY